MAGTLTISTLSDGTNSTSSTNCIQGSAKAWINLNGASGASPTIRASYNFSSITRTAAGQWTATMTNAFADTNYAICFGMQEGGTNNSQRVMQSSTVTKTTSVFGIVGYDGLGYSDFNNIYVSVFR